MTYSLPSTFCWFYPNSENLHSLTEYLLLLYQTLHHQGGHKNDLDTFLSVTGRLGETDSSSTIILSNIY